MPGPGQSPSQPSATRVPASGNGASVAATARSTSAPGANGAAHPSAVPYALPTGESLYRGIAASPTATRPASHSTRAPARPAAEMSQPVKASSAPPAATSMGLLLIVAGGAISYRQLRPRTSLAPAAAGDETAESPAPSVER